MKMLSGKVCRKRSMFHIRCLVRHCASSIVFALVSVSIGCVEARKPTFDRSLQLGNRQVNSNTLNHGEGLYQRYCSRCHGADGSGKGPRNAGTGHLPPDLRLGRYAHTRNSDHLPTHEELSRTIRNGVPARGMPAWPGLSDTDIYAIASYLMTLSSRWRQP